MVSIDPSRQSVVDSQSAASTPPSAPARRYEEVARSLNLAMSNFGSSGSPSRPAPAVGRDGLLDVIAECCVSDATMTTVFFPALENWGTSTARQLKWALEEPARILASTRTAAPLLLPADQVPAALAKAQATFLATATRIVDARLERVVAENVWHASPQGQAYNRALDDHMVALGTAAVESFRDWQAGIAR